MSLLVLLELLLNLLVNMLSVGLRHGLYLANDKGKKERKTVGGRGRRKKKNCGFFFISLSFVQKFICSLTFFTLTTIYLIFDLQFFIDFFGRTACPQGLQLLKGGKQSQGGHETGFSDHLILLMLNQQSSAIDSDRWLVFVDSQEAVYLASRAVMA